MRYSNKSFLRSAGQTILLAVAFGAAFHWLSERGYLHSLEMPALDTLLGSRAQAPNPEITLVAIDDDDYENQFHGRSPLDPEKLRQLIAGIAAGEPKAIVIDVDTSHAPEGSELRAKLERDLGALERRPRLFWAVTLQLPKRGACGSAQGAGRSHEEEPPRLGRVLGVMPFQDGGQKLVTPDGDFGAPYFHPDADGLIRRHQRTFTVQPGDGAPLREIPSLPWAVVQALHPDIARNPPPQPRLLDLRSCPATILTAGDVLTVAGKDGWRHNAMVKNRIVIVGGNYSAGGDFHGTPVGSVSGVDLIAATIATETGGRATQVVVWVWVILLDVVLALIVFLVTRFNFRWGLYTFPIAVLGLPMVASFVAFSRLGLWLNFVPVIFAAFLHAAADHADELARVRGAKRARTPGRTK